jgi:DNA primase
LATRFRQVVLLLDGDATGRAATGQIASALKGSCSVTTLLLAAGIQPDQMSPEEIRQLLTSKERRLETGAN